ncbi:hypothetical protein [uncultured Cohaesibacter sp.]|uniref:hypothetical protein n=1 Tax=uncultured Cohaesibacter sp. TaxID=1002546 RepID=UPI0029C6FEEB|nr:hypothetical protein [uncultured Cohaesibacter sp.]
MKIINTRKLAFYSSAFAATVFASLTMLSIAAIVVTVVIDIFFYSEPIIGILKLPALAIFAVFTFGVLLAASLSLSQYFEKKLEPKDPLRLPIEEWDGSTGITITNTEKTFLIKLNNGQELDEWLSTTKRRIGELKLICSAPNWHSHIDETCALFEKAHLGRLEGKFEPIKMLGKAISENRILLPESSIGFYVFDQSRDRLRRLYAIAYLTDVDFSSGVDETDSELGEEERNLSYSLKLWVESEGAGKAAVHGIGWAASEGPKVISELAISTLNYAGRLRVQEQELKTLQTRLQTTQEQAERKLALRPAAKEWGATATNSVILAFAGLVLFLGTFGLLLWGIYILGEQFMPIVNDPEKLEKYIKIFAEAPIWSAAVITIPAVLLAWLMKHFSRMFVQGFNMFSDARYRKALTQIYSEMGTRDGHKLTDEQKKIIFEAMFKPQVSSSANGDIDPNVLAGLIKMAQKQS